MLPTPFGYPKMVREGRKLLNEVSRGVEGGLPHDYVKWDGSHIPSHHLGDGGHGCCD